MGGGRSTWEGREAEHEASRYVWEGQPLVMRPARRLRLPTRCDCKPTEWQPAGARGGA